MNLRSPFLYFSAGQAISLLGSFFSSFAMGWIILQAGHSSAWLATYLSYSILIFAGLSLVAGKIIDRFSRKTSLLWADALGCACLTLLAILESQGSAGLPAYFIVTFLVQLSGAVIMVGTLSAMADFKAGQDVAKAQATFDTLRKISLVLAPLLAGSLLRWCPRWAVFVLDSATYGVSLAGTFFFLPVVAARKAPADAAVPSRWCWWPDLAWTRQLAVIVGLIVVVNLLYAPVLLLWPLLADAAGQDSLLMGMLSGTFMLGSILGGLWIIRKKTGDPRLQILGSLAVISVGFLALSAGRYFRPGAMMFPAGLVGFGFSALGGPITSLVHARLQDSKKGIFFGWILFAGQVGQPVILMCASLAAHRFGVWSLIGCLGVIAGMMAGACYQLRSSLSQDDAGSPADIVYSTGKESWA